MDESKEKNSHFNSFHFDISVRQFTSVFVHFSFPTPGGNPKVDYVQKFLIHVICERLWVEIIYRPSTGMGEQYFN